MVKFEIGDWIMSREYRVHIYKISAIGDEKYYLSELLSSYLHFDDSHRFSKVNPKVAAVLYGPYSQEGKKGPRIDV